MGCSGKRLMVAMFAVLVCGGCVQRTMIITSDPPGALVFMNEQEIGRTPLKRDFIWYGTYDVQLRLDGYETMHQKAPIIAPPWLWPPFDLASELWPGRIKDERHLSYTLKPASTQAADPAVMLARAQELRGKMESSEFTRAPSSRPTTRLTTKPTTSTAGGP